MSTAVVKLPGWLSPVLLLCINAVGQDARGAEAAVAVSTAQLATARQELLALEHQRCIAIGTADVAVLEKLLADDYVHVHGTAKVDDKTGFIAGIKQRPRVTERGELTIRVYGDTAVITGEQINRMQTPQGERIVSNYVTQVALKTRNGWRYVSFQLTPKPPVDSPVAVPAPPPLHSPSSS